MFTGLIEEVGRVKNLQRGRDSAQLTIAAKEILSDVKVGDSIAVNGVCLTVIDSTEEFFVADIMITSLAKTALGELTPGDRVNLERALAADGRFGGHIVSGHIDGVAQIVDKKIIDIATIITLRPPSELLPYLLSQGSVALDGISLTISEKHGDRFMVSIIPHTLLETTLADKKVGNMVNLETDIIGKYVESLLRFRQEKNQLDLNFLNENGFI
ncbi:MAG: riboflavin synthase [Bacillota bacterium]